MAEREPVVTPRGEGVALAEEPGAEARPRSEARPSTLLRKLAIYLPLTLLILYPLNWALSISQNGGLEGVARISDFVSTLTGARIISEGNGAQLYDLAVQREAQVRVRAPLFTVDEGQILPYNHLPFEALLIAPIIDLPYSVAFVFWTLLNAVALGLALFTMQRVLPINRAVLFIALLAFVSYQPLFRAFILGQNSPLVLLGLCGTYAALRRGREGWAGASLLLVALKPQMLPLVGLLLLLERRWKTLAIFAALLVALCVAVMPVLGPAWPLDYARLLVGVANWNEAAAIDPTIMHNWRGLAANLFGGWAPALVTPLFALLSLASVALFIWAWPRSRSIVEAAPNPTAIGRRDLLWALTVIVALLTSLHVNPHDLTLLLLPAWIVAAHATRLWPTAPSRRWLTLLWAGYAILPITFYLAPNSFLATVPNILLLAFAAVLLAREIGSREPVSGNQESVFLPPSR